MSYIYHGQKGWIKQPNRNFKTFESGLCMIQEQYICRADDVDYGVFRLGDPIADSDPCIDGAYIYPEPSFQNLGNGFIQATVTAYGRINTTGSMFTNSVFAKIPAYINYGDFNNCDAAEQVGCYGEVELQIGSVDIIYPKTVLKIVLPQNYFPRLNIAQEDIVFYDTEGNNITNRTYFPFDFNTTNILTQDLGPDIIPSVYHGDFSGQKIQLTASANDIESTNYGKFTEFVVKYNDIKYPNDPFNRVGIWFGSFYKKEAPIIYYPVGELHAFNVETTYDTVPPGAPPSNMSRITLKMADTMLNNATDLSAHVRDFNSPYTIYATVEQKGQILEFIVYDLPDGTYELRGLMKNDYGSVKPRPQTFEITNP